VGNNCPVHLIISTKNHLVEMVYPVNVRNVLKLEVRLTEKVRDVIDIYNVRKNTIRKTRKKYTRKLESGDCNTRIK